MGIFLRWGLGEMGRGPAEDREMATLLLPAHRPRPPSLQLGIKVMKPDIRTRRACLVQLLSEQQSSEHWNFFEKSPITHRPSG